MPLDDSSNPLNVRRYDTADEFLEINEDALHEHEVEYGAIIGHARRLADAERSETEYFYGVESATGGPVGQAIWIGASRPLAITRLHADVIRMLVERLAHDDLALPGVRGDRESAEQFAAAWTKARDCRSTLQMGTLLYEARSISLPASRGGRMVTADDRHRGIAREWLESFIREALPRERIDADSIDRQIAYHLDERRLVLWENDSGEPTSMASRVRDTDRGATISLVYTPPPLRGRGHAGLVVAHLSQAILDDGKSFCCLYTDDANPISNALYPKLGYRVISVGAHYRFE